MIYASSLISINIRVKWYIIVFITSVQTNYKIIENKYCLWSEDNRGEWFDSSVDAEAYCDDNPACIGYYRHEDDGMWGSCPSDSTEGAHNGTVLYKKGNWFL